MNIHTISDHAFYNELEWLYEVVNGHVEALGWRLAAHRITIPRVARRMHGHVIPYYLAGDLIALFDFARGRREVSADFVVDAIDAVGALLFTTPAMRAEGKTAKLDWTAIKHRNLGLVMLAAAGRSKLREGKWLSQDELKALTGLTAAKAATLGIEKTTVDKRTQFEPKAILQVLEKFGGEHDEE